MVPALKLVPTIGNYRSTFLNYGPSLWAGLRRTAHMFGPELSSDFLKILNIDLRHNKILHKYSKF